MNARSAAGPTATTCVDELSSGSSSFVELVTVAVFGTLVPDRANVACTVIVTVAEAPLASGPSTQVTVPDEWSQPPGNALDETYVMPAGS